MRPVVLTLCLLSPGLAAVDVRAQTAAPRKTAARAPVTKAPVPQATQSANPWKAILRVVPNPLPAGRCATAAVEIQDPDGYRAITLSNGGVVDFHQFVYKSSDTTRYTGCDDKWLRSWDRLSACEPDGRGKTNTRGRALRHADGIPCAWEQIG